MKRFLAAGPSSPRGAGQGLWAGAAAAFPGCDSAGGPVARPAGPQVLQRHPGAGRALILLQPRVGCAGLDRSSSGPCVPPAPAGLALPPAGRSCPFPAPAWAEGAVAAQRCSGLGWEPAEPPGSSTDQEGAGHGCTLGSIHPLPSSHSQGCSLALRPPQDPSINKPLPPG